jgi:hypothetical protein
LFLLYNECNEQREELFIKAVNILWHEIKKDNDLIKLSRSLVSVISSDHLNSIISKYLTKITTEEKVKFQREVAIDYMHPFYLYSKK